MRTPGRRQPPRGFRRQSDHDVDVNLRYDPVVRPERLQQQVTRVRQHQRGVQLLEVGGYELRHLIGESVPSDAQIAQRGNRLHLNLGLPTNANHSLSPGGGGIQNRIVPDRRLSLTRSVTGTSTSFSPPRL